MALYKNLASRFDSLDFFRFFSNLQFVDSNGETDTKQLMHKGEMAGGSMPYAKG